MHCLCVLLVLFMGSEKYPKQNEFDAFLKKHGGLSNASTDCERVSHYCFGSSVHMSLIGYLSEFQTLYHFEVRRKNFKEALDRLSTYVVCHTDVT